MNMEVRRYGIKGIHDKAMNVQTSEWNLLNHETHLLCNLELQKKLV